MTLRCRLSRRWPYSSQRGSSTGDTEMCESEPMPQRPLASRNSRIGEQAVAEVGFRRRAQRDHRAAARDACDLAVVEVGRVHQRPAFADVRVRQQPFDRARAARSRSCTLADLLGDVDAPAHPPAARRAPRASPGRHRAQAVQRAAHAQVRALLRAQGLEQAQVAVHVGTEAPLPRRQRAAVEAAGHVQHRQQGHADAGVARGADERVRHRRRIGVRPAIGRVVAGSGIRRRGCSRLRASPCTAAQRPRAACPDRSVRRCGTSPRARSRTNRSDRLGVRPYPPSRALEGVRMQVGDAGKAPAGVVVAVVLGHAAILPEPGRGGHARMRRWRRTTSKNRPRRPAVPDVWKRRVVLWGGAIAVALAAIAFARASDLAFSLFKRVIAFSPWWALLLTPGMFALLAWITTRGLESTRGSGIPQVIAALPTEAERQRHLAEGVAGQARLTVAGLLGGARSARGPDHCTSAPASCFRHRPPLRFARGDMQARRLLLAGGAAGIAAAFNPRRWPAWCSPSRNSAARSNTASPARC